MEKILEFIKKNNINKESILEILDKKNFLSTAIEVSSISSRLMLNKDARLNKIYLTNLLQFVIQLYYLIENLELYKLYDENFTMDDINKLSDSFVKHIYQAYYAPYETSETDKFKLCNNIGIMSLNLSLALWTDFENNEYNVKSLLEKFKIVADRISDFMILILELYTYIVSYLDKHSLEEIEESLNYLFLHKKNSKLKIKEMESKVEEFSVSDENEINKMNIKTKIIN